ncbi:ankyrin repeat domain-containing protein 65-like [Haliotis cracherodii]|uniref:ankyrin repeat domain-containing protein 65-like n=1 Tax=Haliotis cracherodii TaxID=6455 RepID=UPI0039E85337
MELTRVVFISLVLLCGVRDVHADTSFAAFSRKLYLLDRTIQAWKGTVVDLRNEISNNYDLLELSLKEELTNTFIPALIKPLVKQAITDSLKGDYIGNIIRGCVLDVVNSLKARVHNTKTQLRSVKRQFRKVKRERDMFKKSLGKLRVELTKDIHRDLLGIHQRIQELEERDALRGKHIQDLTEQNQKASGDPSRTKGTPVTTQKPATKATPSPADCRHLCDASENGNLEEVKRLLSLNVNVNCRGRLRRTPVMRAAIEGHRDAVELLVSRGADVSLVDRNGDNIFHLTCWGGDMETVKFVLSLNVEINSRGWRSLTPVMRAAIEGHRDVVELLVSRGANASLVDEGGDNILHLACSGGDMETVGFVLSLNVVDINSRGWRSMTSVMWAALRGNRDVVELLVSKGANVSLVDEDGDNIFHHACSGGYIETVEFVLSLNVVNINSRGWRSLTPVMRAAWEGHGDVVELLVSKRADVSLVDKYGDNILHLACFGGDMETVEFVLSLNVVDIDAKNNLGETAADVARDWGHQPVADLLESRGAQ